jgi:hypothetical protein
MKGYLVICQKQSFIEEEKMGGKMSNVTFRYKDGKVPLEKR